jgi:antitoxin ParD1/3/4
MPELERFARACVDGGRYSNVSKVVRAALRLLQDAEARRQAFSRMLNEIEEETDRNSAFTLESVKAEKVLWPRLMRSLPPARNDSCPAVSRRAPGSLAIRVVDRKG